MERLSAVVPREGAGRMLAVTGVPPVWGLMLLGICILAGSAGLGWFAYQGRVELPLALLVVGAGFFFVVFRPEFGILILISTMLLTYPTILAGSGLFTINNVLGLTLVILLLSRIFLGHDLWFLRERETWLFLILAVLLLLLTGVAEYFLPKLHYTLMVENKAGRIYPARDLTANMFKDLFSRVAFFVFFVSFIVSRRHVRYVLFTVLACILVVIPSAFQVYMSAEGENFRVTAGIGAGWLSNANRFAFMCLLGISVLLYFAATTHQWVIKLAVIPIAGVLAAFVLLSGSRSGFLSLLLVGAWLMFRARGTQGGLRAGILTLSLTAVIIFSQFLPPRLQERLLNINPFAPEGEGSHSTEVRTTTLAESLILFTEYPLTGVGIGNFRWVNLYFHNNYKPPHNSYLWALAEGGIFCFLVYLLLFATLWQRLRRLRQTLHNTDPPLALLAGWLSFYLALFLFFSFFADVWLQEIHLYLIAGLTLVLQRLASTQAGNGQPQVA